MDAIRQSRIPSGIDIVIPIYNARAFVIPCIESVLKYAAGDFRLILVDDASTEPGLSEKLRDISMKNERVVLLGNEKNLGFVGTANRGMRYAAGRDVLLLNSDTEVFPGFLERLQDCVYADETTGIASPFSNNATICSIPDFPRDNPIPEGYTAASFSELVTACSRRLRPELVTAVGFCMYVKADVFKKIGYFDEETFKRGFGEENDFCERAKKAGFKVRLADDVFVFHKGKASFGEEGFSMENDHARLLESKHPGYHSAVAHFIETNPLASIHDEIRFHIKHGLNTKHGAILYFLHSSPYSPLPGGTELHVLDLIRSLASPRAVIMYPVDSTIEFAEIFDGRVETPFFYSFEVKKRANRFCFEHPEINQIVAHCIDLFGITSAHIHHLMNWPVSLGKVLRDKDVPYIYTSHDYYAVCPNLNLFDYTRMGRCSCPDSDELTRRSCLAAFLKKQGEMPPLDFHKFKSDHRKSFMETLSGAQAILFPSERSKEIVSGHLPLQSIKKEVIEHGYDSGIPLSRPKRGHKLNVGILGQVSYTTKGSEQYIELVRRCRNLPVEWHFAGATGLFGFEQKLGNLGINQRIHFHGPYKREDIVNMLAGLGIDLVVILPLWEETYSYILSEALVAGIPVIVSNHGALKERVERDQSGFTVSNAEEAAAIIAELYSKPDTLDELTMHVRSLRLPSHTQNAEEHRKIYKAAGFYRFDEKPLPIKPEYLHELADRRKHPETKTLPGDALHKYQRNLLYPYFLKIRHLIPKSFRQWGKSLLVNREKRIKRKFDLDRFSGSVKGLRLIYRGHQGSKYESLSDDPQFILKSNPFPSNAVQSIRFRISRGMAGYAFSQIYWTHATEESFSEQKSAKIFLNSKTNVMEEYILDLSSPNLSAWRAGERIFRLRFDPVNLPGVIEIGSLELCP